MKNNVSTEYAEALFLLSCEEGKAEEYLMAVELIKEIIESNGDYLSLLASPSIAKEEKLGLIDSAFGGRINENTVSFLKLLCENNRIELLPSCIEEYEKLYNRINKVRVVQVTSAVELTHKERSELVSSLEKRLGGRVELCCSVDKEILGGIIIRTEDTVVDGSLRRKIREVKEVISGESKT